jgi:hypothetical protein
MELRDALTQISQIRQQVAQTEVFRGYRAVPVAFSGLLAMGTAALQAVWLPEPGQNTSAYLFLWLGAAVLSMLATGIEIALHCHYRSSAIERTKSWLAVSQFLPSVAAGALLTIILANYAFDNLWMLPGLWAMLFSLGIFASCRLLPPATFWVGVFYMAAGAASLTWAQDANAFSPWAMGVPFGVGQLLTAAMLYWTLERRDVE